MHDLAVALALVFVIEGIYYSLAPEKAQSMMRELSSLPPEMLRKAGLIIAIVGVIWISFLKR